MTEYEHMDVSGLQCNQEEADTMLLLHHSIAANHGAKHKVVKSPYSDVLVLHLHHRSQIVAKKISFPTGWTHMLTLPPCSYLIQLSYK